MKKGNISFINILIVILSIATAVLYSVLGFKVFISPRSCLTKENIHVLPSKGSVDSQAKDKKAEDMDFAGLPESLNAAGAADEPIIVKGQVIFDDYKQGVIKIAAFDNPDHTSRTRLASAVLSMPGAYVLKLPPGTAKAYFSGYNDSNNDGSPYQKKDPVFHHVGYPECKLIEIQGPVVKGVNLVVKSVQTDVK